MHSKIKWLSDLHSKFMVYRQVVVIVFLAVCKIKYLCY